MKGPKSFKQRVDDTLSPLVLSPEMKQKILQNAAQPQKAKRRPLRFKRACLTAMAACLTLVFGVTVAAAAFPAFEQFITRMGEDLRQMMQPLNETSVSGGIRLEVAAAVNDGESAIVYFTLQDLKHQNRVDENTQLVELTLKPGFTGFAQVVHFEPETQTATYRFEQNNVESLAGEKATLTLKGFVSGQQQTEYADTGLTVADIEAMYPVATAAQTAEVGGYSFRYGMGEEMQAINDEMTALLEEEKMPTLPLGTPAGTLAPSWLNLSGAGVLNGYLHLQRKTGEGAALFGHTEFFIDYDGYTAETPLPAAQLSLGKTTETLGQSAGSHSEDILYLPDNMPFEEMKIVGRGTTYSQLTTGNWLATFTLNQSQPEKEIHCNVARNTWCITRLAVSSIGVKANLQGEISEQGEGPEIEVYTQDGTRLKTATSSMLYHSDVTELRDSFERPVELDSIAKIVVNGETFTFE
ncbi:DUF4179 domain-containing protein [Ruminococcaceae bacterium OttesenSCG-928-A16]|nr:DUF4179 domain-containing protein [Ruminococcaceae bacterium OttesenSCG-928-A16]